MAEVTNKKDLDKVLELYDIAVEGKQEFMEKALEWKRLYRQYQPPLPKNVPPDTPNHVSGKPYSYVELATAKQRSAIIPRNINDPIFRMLPVEPDDIESAQKSELVLNYNIRRSRFRSKINTWLREYNTYGVAPARTFWRFETRKVRQTPIENTVIPLGNVILGIRQVESMRNDHIIYDAPDFEPLSIDDWFPDPSASMFDDFGQAFCIIRYYITKKLARKLAEEQTGDGDQEVPAVFNRRAVEMIPDDELPPPRDSDEVEREEIREIGGRFTQTNALKGLIEVLEYYDGDSIISVANRRYVIRPEEENPYDHGRIPVVTPARIREAGNPYGTGQIEPILPTVEHVISLRNSRSKNINIILNRMWKMLKDAGVDPRDLVTQPNKVVKLTDMDDVEMMDFPDVTANAYNEEAVLNNEMELISGLAGLAAGNSPPSVRSGIQTFPLLDIANERTLMDIETFVDEGMIPLAQHFHWLTHQYATDIIPVRILGAQGVDFERIPKEEIGREFDIFVESAIRTTPKAVEAQQQLAFMNSMAAVLQGFPDMSLRLFRGVAEKQGLKEIVAELNTVIEQVEQERQNQGGIIQGGQGSQALAGAFGVTGGNAGNSSATSGEAGLADFLGGLEEG